MRHWRFIRAIAGRSAFIARRAVNWSDLRTQLTAVAGVSAITKATSRLEVVFPWWSGRDSVPWYGKLALAGVARYNLSYTGCVTPV
jgi:hypothetical protein